MSLAIAEGGPRRAVDRGELDIIEGEGSAEGLTPTLNKKREELLMCLDVMGVGLSLIPDSPSECVAGEWTYPPYRRDKSERRDGEQEVCLVLGGSAQRASRPMA